MTYFCFRDTTIYSSVSQLTDFKAGPFYRTWIYPTEEQGRKKVKAPAKHVIAIIRFVEPLSMNVIEDNYKIVNILVEVKSTSYIR